MISDFISFSTNHMEDVNDSLDLWYALIVSLPALGGVITTLIVTLRGQKKSKERWDQVEQKTNETLYQVKNEHDENLRDEITRGFKEVRADIRSIRDELHTERKERIEGDLR